MKKQNNRREYINRKGKRPFDESKAMHIVMRTHLRSALHVRSVKAWLLSYIPSLAHREGICIYHFVIQSDHLHFVLKARSKQSVSIFLRVLAGVTARRVLCAERGRMSQASMWLRRPYSRVLSWGREFHNALHYVQRNVLEGTKVLKYESRSRPFSRQSAPIVKEIFRKQNFMRLSWIGLQPMLPGSR